MATQRPLGIFVTFSALMGAEQCAGTVRVGVAVMTACVWLAGDYFVK